LPELKQIPLCDIDDPKSPMRSEMNDAKLDELAANMKANGLLQPIGLKIVTYPVAPSPNGNDESGTPAFPATVTRYEVVYGHRRTVCARRLDWSDITALVYGPDERIGAAQMFAENIFREDVNDADVALWIAERVEQDGWDEARLMRETGKKPDWIGDRFRLLRGDMDVFSALQSGQIKFAVARELNKCKSDKYRRFYLAQAIQGDSSSKQVSMWVASTPIELEGEPQLPHRHPRQRYRWCPTAPRLAAAGALKPTARTT
jgi:ParB family chromosome partitioning protein